MWAKLGAGLSIPAGGLGGRRSFAVAVVALAAACLLIAVGGGLGSSMSTDLDLAQLNALLKGAAAALSLIVGGMFVLRWRFVGEAASLWIGASALLLGGVTFGLSELVPLIDPGGSARLVLPYLRSASVVVVLWLLVQAIRSGEPPPRLGRLLAGAGAWVAVLTVAFQLVPHLADLLAGPADRLPFGSPGPVGSVLITLAWLALAGAYALEGLRRGRWVFSWLGLFLLALTVGELSRAIALASGSAVWLAGSELLRMMGLVFGLVAATQEIQDAFTQQTVHLVRTMAEARRSAARVEAEHAAREERAHQARSALAAIQGAINTLERHRDRLSEDDRRSLQSSVSLEIARLQRLVSPEVEWEGNVPLVEVLAPLVAAERLLGTPVTLMVSADLEVWGTREAVTEAVHTLLENARLHAAGSPVEVRAQREGGRVVVRVEDRGPGVPVHRRRVIFARGVRGERSSGSGLGLYIAAELTRRQGGEIWVEDRPDGGASFAMALPVTGAGGRAQTEGGDRPGGSPEEQDGRLSQEAAGQPMDDVGR